MGGLPLVNRPVPTAEEAAELRTGCLEWKGCRDRDGHGRVTVRGKSRAAHRVAYANHHGIPLESLDGLVIRHDCDNPPCVNPTHLRHGTSKENSAEAAVRGLYASGEDVHLSKLTSVHVQEIRRKYAEGGTTLKALATLYGVSFSTISGVIRRKTWKRVP
jgi:hypothetical protein